MNPACPECGKETDTYMGWGTTTGRDHWYCEHCNKIQPIPGRHERQDETFTLIDVDEYDYYDEDDAG